MKCLNQYCDAEDIESDDNFCYKCGHWTAKGFSFIRKEENVMQIMNGDAAKKDDNFSVMLGLASLAFIGFFVMTLIRGNDLYKPFFYLKRQADGYIYGYHTSIIKTDNTYKDKAVNSYDEAIELIKEDLDSQHWKCSHEMETFMYQRDIEDVTAIPVVSFCDVSDSEAQKLTEVIKKMYSLFPNMSGALTNISITNATTNSEYIARFQPMFQFVNANNDINTYNKVNKTQILLNSYYFLNDDIMSNPVSSVVGEDWYVKDATWESTIAHELGHYISFTAFLRQNGLSNITFVTADNEQIINNAMSQFDSGAFSMMILNQALNNYNSKYNTNLDVNSFALTISKYAGAKDKNGNLIADETIAEAIHDYYLHGYNCSKSSYEIVSIIKSKL
ncbi:MAG: hypothetical protein IJI98_07750 [Methanosphaera sp.]|nr:hypothetical protein [Methanosphaera sp.]